jgi:hypothetical protein
VKAKEARKRLKREKLGRKKGGRKEVDRKMLIKRKRWGVREYIYMGEIKGRVKKKGGGSGGVGKNH